MSFGPENPGTSALVSGSTKMNNPKHTAHIKSSVEFRIVLAVRLAFCLSRINNSENTGIKAMDRVPKISRLNTKSGTLKAA